MGKFDKVLIASDFDGTLKTDAGEITQDVRRAIDYYISEGGLFTVCTGRTYQGFHLYDPAYINVPVLLANGAMAYDYAKSKIVFFDGVGEEGLPLVRALAKRFPTVSVEIYPFGDTYAINFHELSRRHFEYQSIEYKEIADPEDAPRPWAKVMLGAQDYSAAVQQFMKENFSSPSFLPTEWEFVEIMKTGVDKGSGMLKLANILGVEHKNCYAIGDGYNDVEMLNAAEAGFVPSNGSPEALRCADYVVRSNNEGAVANVIEILDRIYS